MPRGMPSSTLVRCGFSSALRSSQNATTSSAVSAARSPRRHADAGHHLRGHVRRDILDVEVLAGGVRGDVGVEEHLVEHVAELLDHLLAVAGLDGVDELPALLDEVLHEALVRLLGVPRAAAGRAQQRDGAMSSSSAEAPSARRPVSVMMACARLRCRPRSLPPTAAAPGAPSQPC